MSVSADGYGQWVSGVMSTVSGRIVQGIPGLNARTKPRGGVTTRNIPKWQHSKSPMYKKGGLCRVESVGNYGGSIKGSGRN